MNPEITSPGNNRGLFATIRDRLAHRPDTEHEAALIRIAFAVLISCYLAVAVQTSLSHMLMLLCTVRNGLEEIPFALMESCKP